MTIQERVTDACCWIELKKEISDVAFGLTNDNMSKEEAAKELLDIINDMSEEIL